jgi:hypothetical protein
VCAEPGAETRFRYMQLHMEKLRASCLVEYPRVNFPLEPYVEGVSNTIPYIHVSLSCTSTSLN